jgi:hypothetical protein
MTIVSEMEVETTGWGRRSWVAQALGLSVVIALSLLCVPLPISDASAAPNVIQASKKRGIKQVGDLRIRSGYDSTNLWDASRVLGRPGLIRRPYREVCQAYFGRGLRLDFVSFGLENRCYYRSLQAGLVRSRYWKVKVGQRIYRVGMPKRRIPKRAKFYKGYGYQIASKPFLGRRTGTVFAQIGSKSRIRAFYLYVGLAGD